MSEYKLVIHFILHLQIFQGGSVFTEEDVESLVSKSKEDKFVGVDILLTSCWPQDITQYTNKPVSWKTTHTKSSK